MKSIRVLTATDLHQLVNLYTALQRAVAVHRPDILALAGDFLHAGLLTRHHLTVSECASHLAALPCEVVLSRGNHETENWEEFAACWDRTGRLLHALHQEAMTLGPLVIVGFPCSYGGGESFALGRSSDAYDPQLWLPEIRQQHGAAMGTLWLMHEPPADTRLCPPEGLMAGFAEWHTAIEDYQPWVTISGHDHLTPLAGGHWWDRIGRTVCINVGQPGDESLHYCVMDFEFPNGEPSVPEKVSISAFPWGGKLTIPPSPIA